MRSSIASTGGAFEGTQKVCVLTSSSVSSNEVGRCQPRSPCESTTGMIGGNSLSASARHGLANRGLSNVSFSLFASRTTSQRCAKRFTMLPTGGAMRVGITWSRIRETNSKEAHTRSA